MNEQINAASEPPPAVEEFAYIHEDLRRLAVPVARLLPHPRNARRHPKRNIDEIAASLLDHGQIRAAIEIGRPMVLAGDAPSPIGTLLVGNGMLAAARDRLQWSHLAVLWFTGSDIEARKLALRDNRTSELAEWDYEPLGLELRELGDLGVNLDDVGWNPDEAAPLLEADFTPRPPSGDGATGSKGGVGGSAMPGIHLTTEQRDVVDTAVDECRRRRQNNALTAAECLAIICKEFVDGTPVGHGG